MNGEKDYARAFQDFVRASSEHDITLAIGSLERAHRTHQQGVTRFCARWLESLAKRGENGYDLRNEASVNLGKKFVETISVKDRALPFI